MDDIYQQHEEPLHMALCTLNAWSYLPMDLPSTHALKQGPSQFNPAVCRQAQQPHKVSFTLAAAACCLPALVEVSLR